MRLTIIVPVYNEATTLEKVIKDIWASDLYNVQKEVVAVDDGSSDGSRDILLKLHNEGMIARLVLISKNSGKGAALRKGFEEASGDYVFIQDADAEYDFRDIGQMVRLAREKGSGVAIFGSRFLRKNKGNFFYAFGNVLVTKIFNFFFGTKLTDLATCYKLFPVLVARSMSAVQASDFVFDVVILTAELVRRGFNIIEVPISYNPRPVNEKKLRFHHGMKIILAVFREGLFYKIGLRK